MKRWCGQGGAVWWMALALLGGAAAAQPAATLSGDVWIANPKWTSYNMPKTGAELTLNVRRGSQNNAQATPAIKESHVRIEDESDDVQWTKVSESGDLHVYKTLTVLPGHEWVAITGVCTQAGAVGSGTGASTPSDPFAFEVGVLRVEITGPNKTLVYCEGDNPTITLQADCAPGGGTYSWAADGNIEIVGDTDGATAVIRGTGPSGEANDSEVTLTYTKAGAECESVHKITVQKPTSLSNPVVSVVNTNVFKWGHNYTFTVLDQFGNPVKPIGTASPWWSETKTTCKAYYPWQEPPPNIGWALDGNGQFTDTVAWQMGSEDPPEDFFYSCIQKIFVEGCNIGTRCQKWWYHGASSTAGACTDCDK